MKENCRHKVRRRKATRRMPGPGLSGCDHRVDSELVAHRSEPLNQLLPGCCWLFHYRPPESIEPETLILSRTSGLQRITSETGGISPRLYSSSLNRRARANWAS